MHLIIENVRGFSEPTEVPIGNLTLLIGENSTGKSTILAMLQAVLHPGFPFGENSFNRSPFDLGSFDTIATYKGGKYGRAETFRLGIKQNIKNHEVGVEAIYTSDQGSPVVLSATWVTESSVLKINRIDPTGRYLANFSFVRDSEKRLKSEISLELDLGKWRKDQNKDIKSLFIEGFISSRSFNEIGGGNFSDTLTALVETLSINQSKSTDVISLAPLRTKPRRTYDETKDEFKPEGDHIPLLLSRLANGSAKESDRVSRALEVFGTSSNLFNSIRIKRLGKRPSDPFQVRIKGHGPDVNMVDVGYGVSQALPIIVDSILANRKQLLLVQQPEVHLHPRAQAALGTFFSRLVKTEKKNFVIETHSDYLVDRVRQEIANKQIQADQVKLLFLERDNLDLRIHEINIDSMGNIQDPPSGYRAFFLQEEINILLKGTDSCQQ